MDCCITHKLDYLKFKVKKKVCWIVLGCLGECFECSGECFEKCSEGCFEKCLGWENVMGNRHTLNNIRMNYSISQLK
ncbi:unnamed protein product [Meloidogyne enterolobii]|uniref:Uncharacterized protein n=1 Tax=Meloidogyne enterolobii TaxID=390850 RepID=A0ACB1A6N8_MELEN